MPIKSSIPKQISPIMPSPSIMLSPINHPQHHHQEQSHHMQVPHPYDYVCHKLSLIHIYSKEINNQN